VSGEAATSGIVLAGGASRRFGSDKLAERIDGLTLLERAVASLVGVVDEIVVVGAPGREPPPLSRFVASVTPRGPVRVVVDPEPFGGPLAGLRTGLEAATGHTVVVIGGDMPSIVPAVLHLIAGRPPAALADGENILRPLPCALDRDLALAAAERLWAAGERRLRALLVELGTIALPWTEWASLDPRAKTLIDIDERADLSGDGGLAQRAGK
jgi:molybdenum cofactor guanylyltransferase